MAWNNGDTVAKPGLKESQFHTLTGSSLMVNDLLAGRIKVVKSVNRNMSAQEMQQKSRA